VREVSRAGAAGFAAVAGSALRLLPDRFVIALRSGITLTRRLDYAPAAILLRVTSPFEHDYRLRSCEKEPETVTWLASTITPDSVLYDIGANVGAYALIAASVSGGRATVYAFEPGAATYANLVHNVARNGFGASVVPLAVALGSRTGIASFHYASPDAGAAEHPGVGLAADEPGPAAPKVLAYRLDELVRMLHLQAPTHIKIDVDGAELAVLEGAGDVLRSATLRWVQVEVADPDAAGLPVRRVLETAGFRLEATHGHSARVRNLLFNRVATA
jgi:FkbM family methyltransferase